MVAERPQLCGVEAVPNARRAQLEELEGRVRVGRARRRVEGELQVVALG